MFDFIKRIPVHMDFEGQERSERVSRLIVVLFAAVGLVWGYVIQQFSQTVYILAAGTILAALLTVPPWPLYRRKPLKWQKARAVGSKGDSNGSNNGKDESKGKKKK